MTLFIRRQIQYTSPYPVYSSKILLTGPLWYTTLQHIPTRLPIVLPPCFMKHNSRQLLRPGDRPLSHWRLLHKSSMVITLIDFVISIPRESFDLDGIKLSNNICIWYHDSHCCRQELFWYLTHEKYTGWCILIPHLTVIAVNWEVTYWTMCTPCHDGIQAYYTHSHFCTACKYIKQIKFRYTLKHSLISGMK